MKIEPFGTCERVANQATGAQRHHVPRALFEHLPGDPGGVFADLPELVEPAQGLQRVHLPAGRFGIGDCRRQVIELEVIDAAVGFTGLLQRLDGCLFLIVVQLGEAQIRQGCAIGPAQRNGRGWGGC